MGYPTEMLMGMRGLFRLYDKMLKPICADYELTVVEADIVSFLQNNPGKDTATDIAELRMLSKGAVSKAVESLIGKSLLAASPDRNDRRKIHLFLRSEAAPVTERIDAVREAFLNEVLKGFTAEELRTHEQFCSKLFENTKKANERRIEHETYGTKPGRIGK